MGRAESTALGVGMGIQLGVKGGSASSLAPFPQETPAGAVLAAAAALPLSLRSRVTPCFHPPPAPSAPRPRSALRRPAAPPCPGGLLRPPSRLALPTERGRGPGGHAQRGAPARPPPRLTQPFLLPPTQDAARGERSLRGQAAQAGGGCVPGADAPVHGVGCRRRGGEGRGGCTRMHGGVCACACVHTCERGWVIAHAWV